MSGATVICRHWIHLKQIGEWERRDFEAGFSEEGEVISKCSQESGF